jgi:pilus assembly protein CpaB
MHADPHSSRGDRVIAMRAKTILTLLFLGSLFVIVAIVLYGGPNDRTANATPGGTMVLVAAHTTPAGTLLRPQDVKWQSWNKGSAAASYIVRSSEAVRAAKPDADEAILAELYGAALSRPIESGHPIALDAIVKPADRNFLTVALTPGYRAIAVAATAVSGAAGRIFPGDRVDLILTQSFKGRDDASARRSVSETVIGNLRVLAIDRSTKESGPAEVTNAIPRAVTLEVQPKQAEIISVASELGKLSMTLRSPDSSDASDGLAQKDLATRSTWADDVSPALRDSKAPSVQHAPIRIMRGSKIEEAKQD